MADKHLSVSLLTYITNEHTAGMHITTGIGGEKMRKDETVLNTLLEFRPRV